MTSYPEKIPQVSKTIKQFYFNLDNSADLRKELETQVSNLDDRIDKIVDHFTIQEVPVIRAILGISQDRDELKKLSKALDRVADLVDAKNKITPKLDVIKAAEADPNWFALAFGDFSTHADLELDNILYGDKND